MANKEQRYLNWRITYQSVEHACRAAFNHCESLQSQLAAANERADAASKDLKDTGDYLMTITEELVAERERADGLQKMVDAARAQKPAAWAYRFSIPKRHDDMHDNDAYSELVFRKNREPSPDAPFGWRGDSFSDDADTTEIPLYAAPVPAQPAVVPEGLPRHRLIRIDTVSNTVRVEYDLDKPGKEKLSALIPFDGTYAGLRAILSTTDTEVKKNG